jgi:hypothetical protein
MAMASGVLSTWVNIKYIPWNNFGGLEVEDPVIKCLTCKENLWIPVNVLWVAHCY